MKTAVMVVISLALLFLVFQLPDRMVEWISLFCLGWCTGKVTIFGFDVWEKYHG